jgi:hypothetical protein
MFAETLSHPGSRQGNPYASLDLPINEATTRYVIEMSVFGAVARSLHASLMRTSKGSALVLSAAGTPTTQTAEATERAIQLYPESTV